MAQAAQKMEELTVPDGGIGNLVMDDAEIEAAYGPDETDFGSDGIAQFPALTKKMAAMGREGDNAIAHLQTGELVIPKEFLDANPEWKRSIFKFLTDHGIEDPERYVVGSKSNSIHPETGAPEFFIKWAYNTFVKPVVKTVSKAVKTVVNVVKKVAPIVLPIALSFTPLGPIYGAALGSGIGTLINGGSIKDALKSALISGATGAVFQGFTGSGSFMDNVGNALADPAARFSQTIAGAQTTASNIFGGEAAQAANAGQQTLFSDYVPAAGATGAKAAESAASQQMAQDVAGATGTPVTDINTAQTFDPRTTELGGAYTPQQVAAQATSPASQVTQPYNPPSFTQSIKSAFDPTDNVSFTEGMKNAFFPSDPTPAQLAQLKNSAYTETFNNAMQLPGMTPQLAAEQAMQAANAAASSAGPGLIRSYAPLALAGTAAATAMGAFTPEQPEDLTLVDKNPDGSPMTGADLIEKSPGDYLVRDLDTGRVLDPGTGQYVTVSPIGDLQSRMPNPRNLYEVPTSFKLPPLDELPGQGIVSTPGGPFKRPYVTQRADGGAIFPRRNGGIMPDEGIPGKDSVRAMLMPGEFVMTTDAVRGMGNGNLNNGIKNMYSVMRNLERRGKAMA